jgi:putative phosphoribosyl transferase
LRQLDAPVGALFLLQRLVTMTNISTLENGVFFQPATARFHDRIDAGCALAKRLNGFFAERDTVVLALPRGGVPVGLEVAKALAAPLDVFFVRKLRLPGHREFSMGTIASGGVRVLNDDVVEMLQIPAFAIDTVASWEHREIERRERLYRAEMPPEPLEDRSVVLVDDGLATGSLMRAAVRAIRAHKPSRIVVAVPVASAASIAAIRAEADGVVSVYTPDPFHAVGLWYQDFTPTTDGDVIRALAAARTGADPSAH